MPYGESYEESEFDADKIPEALPDGWYPARVADVTKEKVEESGAPMANVRFLIRGGDFEGQSIFRRFPLPIETSETKEKGGIPSGKAMQYGRFLIPFLTAIGASRKGLKPDTWIGTEVWIQVATDTFKGAKQSNIVGYSSEKPTAKK